MNGGSLLTSIRAAAAGLLLFVGAGALVAGMTARVVQAASANGSQRFIENEDGTVLDTKTSLLWLADANIFKTSMPNALAQKYLLDMNEGAKPNFGHADWRLPTVEELGDMVAAARSRPFRNVQADGYWSSSRAPDIVELAWVVDLTTGRKTAEVLSQCNFKYLWPVRSAPAVRGEKSGMLLASGTNRYGQLGNGNTADRATLTAVPDLDDVRSTAAGLSHVLALTANGTLKSWGRNTEGQLGNGSRANSSVPVAVRGLKNVVAISAGPQHSMAVRSDGTVWAWGKNSAGQLGNDSFSDSDTPVRVKGLTQVVRVSAGDAHTVALRADGTVWAWGKNSSGQLGDGTNQNRSVPVAVSGLANVIRIAAGGNHSIALRSDRTVLAWGDNASGELGDGSTSNRPLPVQVAGLSQVVDIAAGMGHSLALGSDGKVRAWGSNAHGQLGIEGASQKSPVMPTENLGHVTRISAGAYHSLALNANGTLSLWGKYLAASPGTARPFHIKYLKDIFGMAGGEFDTFVLTASKEPGK